MKTKKLLRTLLFIMMLGFVVASTSSCSKDDSDKGGPTNIGKITGKVTDEADRALEGVTVKVSGVEATATTAADGSFTVENVSVERHSVTFTKVGYEEVSLTVQANKFNADKVATISASMVNASAKIIGKVLDAKNGGAALAGATVSAGGSLTATTAADGTFAIDNIAEKEYLVTLTKTGYVDITKAITLLSFVDGVADLGEITMGGQELLPGKTKDDLQTATKWIYNDYKQNTGDGDAVWDTWSSTLYSYADLYGIYQLQNEGLALIPGDNANNPKPANIDKFESYMYGSKLITEENKIMSVHARTHRTSAQDKVIFGVQVVDLSVAEPVAKKVGENKSIDSGNYEDFSFDLSEYVGKEVIVALGVYREKSGLNAENIHMPIRRIAFGTAAVTQRNWLPGEEFISGWRLTKEAIKSTMVQTQTKFIAHYAPLIGKESEPNSFFKVWHDGPKENTYYIGKEWMNMPLAKHLEPFRNDGYIIKTAATSTVDTEVPQSYIYAKFHIGSNNDELNLKVRTIRDTRKAYFKVTAIKSDFTYDYLAPNPGAIGAADANGTWAFVNNQGGYEAPDDYALFTYDLASYSGQDIVIAIGIHVGSENGANPDEYKLAIHSIELK